MAGSGPEHFGCRRSADSATARSPCPDGLYWDILGLYQDILDGLGTPPGSTVTLSGVAIDSWAVDYGVVGIDGALVGNPRHYRDPRTAPVIDAVHSAASADKLYATNGLQFLPFNTLYQFAADPRIHEAGVQALLIPDLLGYWLTGQRVAEDTNASTTGLLDARTGQWSTDLIDTLGLPTGLLPRVVPPGTVVGDLTSAVSARLGLDRPLTLSTVGSHDTASAIVGVPADGPELRLHLLRHLGSGRRRTRRTRSSPRRAGRRTSPTNAASTAPSDTCGTSWGCGCCRKRSAPGNSRVMTRV